MDITGVIIEQAVIFGRTVTISPADMSVARSEVGDGKHYINVTLAGGPGEPRQVMMLPTHGPDGCPMDDDCLTAVIRQLATQINELRTTPAS